MKAYEEVIDFIASGPSPASIVSFRPSPEASERVSRLIEREKTTGLPPEDKAELDHYMELEHIMRLAKARARQQHDNNPENALAWFCIRSQLKHEHIAAAHLRRAGIEVLLPRIRFKKATARGPVWVTEVLFPSYLFARFNWRESLRLVHHAPGVSRVVSFGQHWPTIPEESIAELRETVGDSEVHVISETVQPGESVQISGGAFHGLKALVTQVFPAKERVRVLLEFLGRQTVVEIGAAALVREEPPRKRL